MIALPERLSAFFKERALTLDGAVWDGAPFGVRGGRIDTCMAPRSPQQISDWLPLLDAGPDALRVQLASPHAVRLEESQQVIASTLEDFEASLLPKPSHLQKLLPHAYTLIEEERYEEADAYMARMRRAFELGFVESNTSWMSDEQQRVVSHLDNLQGICALHRDDAQGAEAYWGRPAEGIILSAPALLNLADLYLDQERWAEVPGLIQSGRYASSEERAYLVAASLIALEALGAPLDEMFERLKTYTVDERAHALLERVRDERAQAFLPE